MLNEEQLILRDDAVRLALEAGFTFPLGTRDPAQLRASPGRFEGEPFYLPYFYHAALEGDADALVYSGGAAVGDVFLLTDNDRAAFTFGPGADFLVLWYSETGYITGELLTASAYNALRASYETEEP